MQKLLKEVSVYDVNVCKQTVQTIVLQPDTSQPLLAASPS